LIKNNEIADHVYNDSFAVVDFELEFPLYEFSRRKERKYTKFEEDSLAETRAQLSKRTNLRWIRFL
jgi:hypothetical protein